MPTPVLNKETPISRLLHVQPNYDFLRIFGCACWPSIRKYNTHKLDYRSKMCVFVGYSPIHKGYKCLDRSTGRIYISRDVIFDESVFPFSTPGVSVDISPLAESISFPSNEQVTSAPMRKYDLTYLSPNPPISGEVSSMQVLDIPSGAGLDHPINMHGEAMQGASSRTHMGAGHDHPIDMHGEAMQGTSSRAHVAPGSVPGPDVFSSPRASFPDQARRLTSPVDSAELTAPVGLAQPVSLSAMTSPTSSAATPSAEPLVDPAPTPMHTMVTRLRDDTRKEKRYTDGTVRYDPRRRAFFAAPSSHHDALREPSWRAAMEDAFAALCQTKTWTL